MTRADKIGVGVGRTGANRDGTSWHLLSSESSMNRRPILVPTSPQDVVRIRHHSMRRKIPKHVRWNSIDHAGLVSGSTPTAIARRLAGRYEPEVLRGGVRYFDYSLAQAGGCTHEVCVRPVRSHRTNNDARLACRRVTISPHDVGSVVTLFDSIGPTSRRDASRHDDDEMLKAQE